MNTTRTGARIEYLRDMPARKIRVDNGRDGARLVRITQEWGQYRLEVGFDDGGREVWLVAAYGGDEYPDDAWIIRNAYNPFGTYLALRLRLSPLTDE